MKKEILNNDAVTLRVGESVTDILDETSDVIEQTLETIENQAEKVITITKNNPLLMAGIFVVGLGIGGFVAYKMTRKKLTAEFEEELTEQLAAAKVFHKRLAKEGEFGSPESAVEALVPDEVTDAVLSYQGRPKTPYNKIDVKEGSLVKESGPGGPVVEQAEVTTHNVFADARTNPLDWDYDIEIANREANPDVPFVISFEEFEENSERHEQVSVLYFAEDNTLADEREEIIDNTEYTVGDDNLTRFGHGSHDPNTVYVRNLKTSMDFEVVRSEGAYHKEVLGLDTPNSMKHSMRHPNRSRRSADE